MQPIEKCDLGHCCYHFPQFKHLEQKEFMAGLERAIADLENPKEYAFRAYENREFLVAEYKKALAMPFIMACDHIITISHSGQSYVRPNLYLDKRGGVAEFIPCCL